MATIEDFEKLTTHFERGVMAQSDRVVILVGRRDCTVGIVE